MANGDLLFEPKRLARSVVAPLGNQADPYAEQWVRDEYIHAVGPEIGCPQYGLNVEEWKREQESRRQESAASIFKKQEVVERLRAMQASIGETIRLMSQDEVDFDKVESELWDVSSNLSDVQFEVSIGKR